MANRKKRAFFRKRNHVKTLAYNDDDRAHNRMARNLRGEIASARAKGFGKVAADLVNALSRMISMPRQRARG